MDIWKKTQENKGARRNECGSYGINVARSDPHLLYGVNCYGVKPSPRGNEKIKHSYMSDKEREKLLKMDEFKKILMISQLYHLVKINGVIVVVFK